MDYFHTYENQREYNQLKNSIIGLSVKYDILNKFGPDALQLNGDFYDAFDRVRLRMLKRMNYNIIPVLNQNNIFESDQLIYLRGPKSTESTEHDDYFIYDNAISDEDTEMKEKIIKYFPREDAEEFLFECFAETNMRFVERGLILPDGSATVAIYLRKLDPNGQKKINSFC